MYEIAFENFEKERAKLYMDINEIQFLYPFLCNLGYQKLALQEMSSTYCVSKAIIYCRVESTRKDSEFGLGSQRV